MNLNLSDPLSALLTPFRGGKYDFQHLTYPLKFDSLFTQGHYMNFYINIHNKSGYNPSNKGLNKSFSLPGGSGLFGIKPTGGNAVLPSFDTVGTLGGDHGAEGTASSNTYKRIKSAISLYIPDSVRYNTSAEWNGISETKTYGKVLSGLQYYSELGPAAKTLEQALRNNDKSAFKTIASEHPELIKFAASSGFSALGETLNSDFLKGIGKTLPGRAGYAVNDQILVLYKGLGMRDFSFDFYFTPANQQEALNVESIIKAFRFHAAPEVVGTTGRFHIAPSTFDIEFFHKSAENTHIPKISTCVLTSINVDYAPLGWSTHTDGMPVQTRMELKFMETQLITKEKIQMGF